MLYAIITIDLFFFAKTSANVQYCRPDNTGSNKCHDGGCGYYKYDSADEICACSFSNGVMNGEYCGVYDDKCVDEPCKNGGKCTSGIGHHICDCAKNFYGVSCELTTGKSRKLNYVLLGGGNIRILVIC